MGPGEAFDDFLREEAPTSVGQRVWTPADGAAASDLPRPRRSAAVRRRGSG